VGLINTLIAQIDCNNTSGYTTTNFTATENNTVSLVCYTTIIFCDICTKIDYYNWGQIGQQPLTPTTKPSSIIISTSDPQYEVSGSSGSDRTFWGLSTLNFSRGNNR
jgi:hypothetical protein